MLQKVRPQQHAHHNGRWCDPTASHMLKGFSTPTTTARKDAGHGRKRRTIAPAWKGPRTRRPVNIRCVEGRALPSDPDVGVQVTFAPRCAEECLVDVCGQVGLNESERGNKEGQEAASRDRKRGGSASQDERKEVLGP